MSVLNSKYSQTERPYSQNELRYLRNNIYKNIRLSKEKVFHDKCNHFYYIKQNSKKEKDVLEKNTNLNVGNCSVCWKLYNTPQYLRDKAQNMIEDYCNDFREDPQKLSYDLVDLENVFYRWLYLENFK